MPASLSGEYLKFGTLSCLYDPLQDTQVRDGLVRALNLNAEAQASDGDGAWIPRALYSMGVIVVAPVGILYHISMVVFRALQQVWTCAPAERKNANTWMWQHLYALTGDLLAFGMILLGTIIVASVVASIAFLEFEWLIIPVAILLPQIFEKHSSPGEIIMPYNFAENPLKITETLLMSYAPAGQISEEDKFSAEFGHFLMRKAFPNHIKESLTQAEIMRLAALIKDRTEEGNAEIHQILIRREDRPPVHEQPDLEAGEEEAEPALAIEEPAPLAPPLLPQVEEA